MSACYVVGENDRPYKTTSRRWDQYRAVKLTWTETVAVMAIIKCRISRGEDLLFDIANRASLAMIAFYAPREETRDLGSSQSREASSEAE
jgi:hypothetical protein